MVIFGSSRQGRRGEVVSNWARRGIEADGRFEMDFVDSRDLNLPFYDEPFNPLDRQPEDDYTHPEGRAWAQRVARAEALIIITPEYNHGYPAVLKNALDWVGPEWGGKPVGFISYGGLAGGARAVEQLRTVATELGLAQLRQAIHFPFFKRAFDENGQPIRADYYREGLQKMLDELIRLHNLFRD